MDELTGLTAAAEKRPNALAKRCVQILTEQRCEIAELRAALERERQAERPHVLVIVHPSGDVWVAHGPGPVVKLVNVPDCGSDPKLELLAEEYCELSLPLWWRGLWVWGKRKHLGTTRCRSTDEIAAAQEESDLTRCILTALASHSPTT